MQPRTTAAISHRQREIVKQYEAALDRHINDIRAGKVEEALEIRDFAALLHIHPVHLSNTVKGVTGRSTCDLFEERLVALAKELLISTDLPIGHIAAQMTYDPSNFTKFFKQFTGTTPKKFRDSHRG